ncbi:carboxypeptidase-like regulatory domain-containing protein [Flavobacterium lindanitolerans]|uniref:Carboxypeptidase-like protein n=1 Tax=Flavobacterium lindanitolerans TaxID=428988 RepID=A0A497V0A5_9FLAO|nr:carboxypeptidase-like regulatory domain-containing protein [Flavobacterium lindanitolerans]MBC8643440.1 carboxypeptidase-like regulatory domain-containing protein [Flavobacterium lindanitolerans]PKW28890.1 carboxypeptidase-like protein [Flavobacterium lindanitolerans]RLJ35607.1 carboxypeptidase-like protein [Flavobacterium lindanitolerans]
MRLTTILFLFFTVNVAAQTKGVVKDSLTGNPIAYVSIWVENENIGTTSEENGEYQIGTNDKNKNLIFSALGYQKKTVKVSESQIVLLSPSTFELDEVTINNKKEKKQLEIGKTKNTIAEAFDNGPRMDAKFFPYYQEYKKTRWIQKAIILTDSRIDDATIKLHLYDVDENGFPGNELLSKDYIITIKKGVTKNEIDLSDFNLEMPKTGIFVVFEKLLIKKNRVEKTIKNFNTNTTKIQTTYAPLVLYNAVERDFLYSFSGGRWLKRTREEMNPFSVSKTIYEPSVTLILTN